ncbi:MAG: hypothetical protein ACRD2C_14755 [Acidimicrobiales bacterium]
MHRTLIGLVTASLLLTAACSDDDDASGLSDITQGSDPAEAEQDSSGEPATAGGSGYTEGFEASFMSRCVSGAATEEQCQCVLDEFVANVPYEEYIAVDEALQSGEMGADELPEWLTGARETCGVSA